MFSFVPFGAIVVERMGVERPWNQSKKKNYIEWIRTKPLKIKKEREEKRGKIRKERKIKNKERFIAPILNA